MPVKRIMDTPLFHNSGMLRVPVGDSTCFYELNNVNYVWLNSEHNFDLLINDVVIINTLFKIFESENNIMKINNDKITKIVESDKYIYINDSDKILGILLFLSFL